MSELSELREKFEAKQDALAEVFKEAKTDSGEYDFRQVKCLGEEVKGSVAVAEKVGAMNAELDEIGADLEKLQAAEDAAKEHARRENTLRRPPHPAPGDGKGRTEATVKSLGELVTAEARFQDWLKNGCAGGISLQFPDMYGSDLIVKGRTAQTIGKKTLFETTAGWGPESTRIPGYVEGVTRPLQLTDIIPLAQTGQEQIVYMEETTRAHAAAEVDEGGAYAESTFELTEKTSSVRKIGDSIPVTDEQLEDVAQVESYLNNRLIFGVDQRIDGQILIGNGTPPNLRGIKNVVGIQTQALGGDPVPDAFYKAMVKVRVTGRAMPTHHVIHPTDWQGVRLLKTADGIYIYGSPSEAGPDRMWGLPVVQQDADAAGTGYVGSFMPAWISLFERRGIDVQIGYVGTQFTEGKRTMRADARVALVVFRPTAFCSVTGL